jgi:hypothetical protein
MNHISFQDETNIIKYILRGPLNKTLKAKQKNKTQKILNNSHLERDLTKLYITKENAEDTITLIEKIQTIKPDIKVPAVQLSIIYNNLDTNILTNSKKGTYIKIGNKNNYFNNIGNPTTSFSKRTGYFLRKGAGSILITHVIKEMKEKGIKTILVHPSNRALEKYYSTFGFRPILKVPVILGKKLYYESNNDAHIMYLEL